MGGGEGLQCKPVAYGANALVVDEAGVRGGAGNNEFRSVKQGCRARSRVAAA
jgi:hypothetical protein